MMEENGNGVREHTDIHHPRLNEVAEKFLADLEEEKKRLNTDGFPLVAMLLDEAYDRVCATGRLPGKEYYADVYKQKPLKLTQKVYVPVKQYPKFNFAGKILGPKGNSLRRLQEETRCKIFVKGRNSMRDRIMEDELRNLHEPRYAHLHKDLFLEISTIATPAESYARVAYALAEIRKFLVPDKNDEVSHDQLRELMEIDPQSAKRITSSLPHLNQSILAKKFQYGSIGVSQLRGQIQYPSHNPEQEEEVEGEEFEAEEPAEAPYPYVHVKHPNPTYSKAPVPGKLILPHKRPGYGKDVRRLNEDLSKSIKLNPYSILKKYRK